MTLADPSERLLEVGREKVAEAGVGLAIQHADARDLSAWPEACFDAVVGFGPFYHLIEAADRQAAVGEIHRVLRPGGLLLAQVIPYLSGVRGIIERASFAPSHVEAATLRRVLDEGVFVNASEAGFPEGWYPRSAEVEALFGAAFERVRLESLRGVAMGAEQAVLDLRDRPELFELAMQAIRETATDRAAVRLGGHAVWIGRRA